MSEVDNKIKREFDSIVKKTKKSFENENIDSAIVDRILGDMLDIMLENDEYRIKVKKDLREDKLKRIVDE